MALKNIIALASILIAAVSCSMEDELINSAANEKQAAEDGIACIALNVHTKSLETKAGNSQNGTGSAIGDGIEDCSLIILNDDNSVYAAYDGLAIEGGQIKATEGAATPFFVQAKVSQLEARTFKAMVVVNTTKSYAKCANLTKVQEVVLTDTDMNNNVKVSQLETLTVTGKSSLAAALAAPSSFTLTVQQITAQVQLEQVNITSWKADTKAVDVKIKNITLVNRNTTSATILNDAANKSYDNITWAIDNDDEALPVLTAGVATFAGVTDKPYFNTFSNATPAAGKATILRFTLVYDRADGSTEREFEFAINRPNADDFSNDTDPQHDYIKSGYVYKVRINATLTSNSIDVDVLCDTQDWIYNYLEVNMEDVR